MFNQPTVGGETAGGHLVTDLVTAGPAETVGRLLARLPGQRPEIVETIFLVDAAERLIGTLPLALALQAPPERVLAALATVRPPSVTPTTDQEHVASLALQHGLTTIPVVDAAGRLIGAVPPTALLAILRREHVEDLHRLAGIHHESDQARQALEAPPVRRARDRLPWLLTGLAGSIIATIVMASFEQLLAGRVAISFFVPGIVYLADAIGTQTETITVRGLSLSQAGLQTLLLGELRTGGLIGAILGLLTFPVVLLGFGDARLATAVALALLAAGTVATSIGLLLPWLLAHSGHDPAYGSGPVATIIQDVLSLLIYFLIVQGLLG
jgi:magnesium transporter